MTRKDWVGLYVHFQQAIGISTFQQPFEVMREAPLGKSFVREIVLVRPFRDTRLERTFQPEL